MEDTSYKKVVLAGCTVVMIAVSAWGQDWPQWRGPNRDGKVTGFTAPQQWPGTLAQKWKVTVGTGCATPALVAGKLYVFTRQGDEEVVLCLDAATGQEKWKDTYAAQTVTGAGRGTHAVKIEKQGDSLTARKLWSNMDLAVQFNTPVLKDGLLFALSNSGNLFCINAQTGQTTWTDATQRDRSGFTAILDAGSCLLALPSNSELIVFQPSREQYTELAKIKVADTPTYAHPVIAGNCIYVKDQETLAMLAIE